MNKTEALGWLKRTKVVPVIRAHTADQALQIAELLHHGGIDIFEITMTVPGAVEVIRLLRAKFGDRALVGAGAVLDAESARKCIANGAQFLVAPNTNPEVVKMCLDSGLLCAPGALTPSEVVAAHELGADLVKVFPCEAMGGPKYIKALKAPLPHIDLMPTGGVDLGNLAEFFKAGACCVGVGGKLVDLSLLETNPKQLAELARAFVLAAQSQL